MTTTIAAQLRSEPTAGEKSAPSGTAWIVPTLAGVSGETLAASFGQCAEVTRRRARNFYHGLKLTPEPRRSAIYAVYAWMRAADDEVDEPGDLTTKRSRLATFARRTDDVLRHQRAEAKGSRLRAGEGATADFWTAFAATVHAYRLDQRIFHDMIAGLEDDLKTFEYLDEAQLSRYCYRVAATAGLACLWIWGLRAGVDRAVAERLAVERGQAFQRTNILRDFREDFDSTPRRVYIPREALDRHRLTGEQLRSWAKPDACAALIGEQAKLARGYYESSAPLDEMIDPACRPTLWAMTRIYSGILRRVEVNPASVVSDRRIRLSGIRKASIALRATAAARLAGASCARGER